MRAVLTILVMAGLAGVATAQDAAIQEGPEAVQGQPGDVEIDPEGAALGMACMAVFVLGGAALYFAPTGIALFRGHQNIAPIIVVNVLLGWSLVGWVVSLAWSFSAQEERQQSRHRKRKRANY